MQFGMKWTTYVCDTAAHYMMRQTRLVVSMAIELRTYAMFVKRYTHSHNVYDYWVFHWLSDRSVSGNRFIYISLRLFMVETRICI